MNFFNNLNEGLSLIYGSSATGKTTLGLQKTLEISRKNKVLFLDTENTFSTERLNQMDSNYKDYLDNILIITPKNFIELETTIKKIKKISNKFKALFSRVCSLRMYSLGW